MRKKLVLGVVLLGALLYAGGHFLSGDWSAERSTVIAAERSDVYSRIASPRAWADFCPWSRVGDPALEWVYEGPESGLGASMTWTGKDSGNGKLDITAADPATGIEYELVLGPSARRSTGAIRLAEVEGGVRLVWTSAGDAGDGLLSKYLAALGVLGARAGGDCEEGLERLKARLER